jgi:hypothetical protein
MRTVLVAWLACLMSLLAMTPFAQPEASVAATAPCTSAAHRQFDFWLGTWKVYDWKTNALQGTNDVTSELAGCVLQEHWKGTDGSRGSSFNAYDPQRRVWHQSWVDDGGHVLLLDGGLVGRAMVLSGSGFGASGKRYRQRIVWSPLPGGDVRQVWQVSHDGVSWKDVFDGRYRKS